MKKEIGIMCATYNEAENVAELVRKIDIVLTPLNEEISYRFLFIDNSSTDGTQDILRRLSEENSNISCIFNERNYGANRSSFHGMVNCPGDAVIMICADFQDPPEMLPPLIEKWLEGNRVVMARKVSSLDAWFFQILRTTYYNILALSHPMYRDIIGCTGFGIYDRAIVNRLDEINDNYPFFRGIIAEVCSSIAHVDYARQKRAAGKSSMNLYRLWDEGVIGLINNSKLAIRLITIFGFLFATIALVLAIFALTLKIIFWDLFPIGIIPILLLQLFGTGSVMLSLGVIGEYVGGIYTQSLGRKRVYEKERLNF